MMRNEVKRTAGALAVLLFFSAVVFAASPKLEPIKVRPGDTLWSISQKYLKDPTLWGEILKYNKGLKRDPTVALPGMVLQVPTRLIKERFRAAKLIAAVNKVSSRDQGKAAWRKVKKGKLLYHGDGIKTGRLSRARVQFHKGSDLTVLANSMAILKSPKKAKHNLYLNRGKVVARSAIVETPSAVVTPKSRDAKFSVDVKNDLSTRVKVFKGQAEVRDIAGLKTVMVQAGEGTNIALDGLPTIPVKIPNMNVDMDANIALANVRSPSAVRVAGGTIGTGGAPGVGDVEQLALDLQSLSIGMPVAAYHVQVSKTRNFGSPIFSKTFDAYKKVDMSEARLPAGRYYVRVAIIDLLGDRGKFSTPRPYQVGGVVRERVVEEREILFEVTRPRKRESSGRYKRVRISGRADAELSVTINGERVPKDEDGNFSKQVVLKKGVNRFKISGVDLRGNERTINRVITYRQ